VQVYDGSMFHSSVGRGSVAAGVKAPASVSRATQRRYSCRNRYAQRAVLQAVGMKYDYGSLRSPPPSPMRDARESPHAACRAAQVRRRPPQPPAQDANGRAAVAEAQCNMVNAQRG